MNANKAKWVRLGDYIEEQTFRVGSTDHIEISGINIEKGFIPTVADMTDVDICKYKLVPYGYYACNLMHVGRDVTIPLAYNNSRENLAVSPAYYTFHIKDEKRDKVLPEYLEMVFNISEFGRLAWFHTDASIRGNLPEKDFKDILIPLPTTEVQQELVDTYNGLKSLAEQNEALIEPLSKACEAFVSDCQSKYPQEELGKYIEVFDKRNTDGNDYLFYGINKDKTFMPTVADTNNLDSSKYKVVNKGDFVFSGMQTGRDICIRIALYNDIQPIIISPAYTTFKIKDETLIIPQYFFLQFKRFEMDRYGWFLSDGSIRSNLEWERFCNIRIPLPSIEVQQSIVNLYNCMEEAKRIASEAREQLKTLCPALIQRAANS